MYNIGNLPEKVITISEICGYKKGFLTILIIFLSGGKKVKLAVWQKDKIIEVLDERRQAFFRSLGKEYPN